MAIGPPESEDPALTPKTDTAPSPTELLKAALGSETPLAERFSARDFAACAAAACADGDAEAIARAARRCFEGAPPKQLRSWATHLLCCRCTKSEDGPFGLLSRLADQNQRACGHVFAAGDIAWNCRTCQKDNTCVLCDACFRSSNHEGHEVFFHRAAPGGCCDCGDPEAWVAEGCCAKHRPSALTDEDPLNALPPGLKDVGAVVVREAARYVVGAAVRSAGAHEPAPLNPAFNEAPAEEAARARTPDDGEGVRVRLHDDDVHSYDDVIGALAGLGLSVARARDLAGRIDREGDALLPLGDAPAALRAVHARGLLGAAVDDALLERELRATHVATWLSELVRGADALRRLVADAFAASLPMPDKPGAPALLQSSRFALLEKRESTGRRLVLDEDPQAPGFASSAFGVLVACDALLPRPLRSACHDVLLRALVDAVARKSLADALLGAYGSVSRLFARGVGTADDTIFALSVQIFTTPSLVRRALAPRLNDSVLAHGGVLAVVLRALLACLGSAGCDAARERRREGRHARPSRRVLPLPDFEEPLTPRSSTESDDEDQQRQQILDRWRREDQDAGATPRRRLIAPTVDPDRFLEEPVVQHRRFAHALRDFEYALQTERVASEMLRAEFVEEGGPGRAPLRAWLALLSRLQGVDESTRRDMSEPHVEFESRRWVPAFNLALNVASATELLVARALEVDDGKEAALGALWGGAAALLEWLAARAGTFEWRRVSARSLETLTIQDTHDVVLYDVCSQPVSLHLPLHRFVAAAALKACAIGLDPLPPLNSASMRVMIRLQAAASRLEDLSDDEDDDIELSSLKTLASTELGDLFGQASQDDVAGPGSIPNTTPEDAERVRNALGRALVDHPLRALACGAHVASGLWRRNGHAALSAALSYVSPPLCHALRDADVSAVQVGALALGGEAVARLCLERFCVDRYLLEPEVDGDAAATTSAGACASQEAARAKAVSVRVVAGAIASALRLPATAPAPAGVAEAPAQPLQTTPPPTPERRRALRLAAAAAVAGAATPPRGATGGRRGGFRVARGPPGEDADEPTERIGQPPPKEALAPAAAECLQLIGRLSSDLAPPQGHEALEARCRRELVHALAVQPQRHSEVVAIVAAAAKAFGGAVSAGGGAARNAAVVPMEELLHQVATKVDARGELWDLRKEFHAEYDPAFARLSRADHEKAQERVAAMRRRLHVSGLPLVGAPAACHASFTEVRRSLLRSATVHRALDGALSRGAHAAQDAGERELEGAALHLATLAAHDADNLDGWAQGVYPKLLDLRDRGGFGSPLYDDGLTWLIEAGAKSSSACAALLKSRAPVLRETPASPDESREERATKARRRAMARMKAHQDRFAALLAAEEAKTEETKVEAPAGEVPTCIMCRTCATPEDPLGFVALAQRSCVLARQVDRAGRGDRRRWVANRACRARALLKDGRPRGKVVLRLKRGDEINVTHVRGGAARVTQRNVCGWVLLRDQRPAGVDDALVPLQPSSWKRWGRVRVHVASCGHRVHYGCWDAYYASVLQKYLAGETSYDGRFCVDVSRREFLCPLCKGLANCLVPSVEDAELASRDAPAAPPASLPETVERWHNTPPAPDAPRTALDGAARRLVDALSDAADGGAAPPALRPPAAALSAWAACGFSLLAAVTSADASALRAARACGRALRCGGVDGYAMVGGGSTLSARLCNLLAGDVLLRSPPTFREQEEAWERESITTHTSSAERLLLRKYGLRRFVEDDVIVTIRADALEWDGARWLCRTYAESGETRPLDDELREKIAAATPALPLGLCHAPFALARPDGANAPAWRGEGRSQRTDEALRQPLLCWDLMTFFCGCCSLWPRGDLNRLRDVVVFARVVQLLLEPAAPTSDEADERMEEVEGLRILDRACRAAAGLAPRSQPPSPSALRAAVQPLAKAIDVALEACAPVVEPLDLSFEQLATPPHARLAESWCRAFGALYAGAPRPPLKPPDVPSDEDDALCVAAFDDDVQFKCFDASDGDASSDDAGDLDDGVTHPILGDDNGVASGGDAPTPLLASLAGHSAPDASGRRHATWDVSHLGLRTLEPSARALRFVRLPASFTELYARLRDARALGSDDVDHGAAICLLTGRVLHAGAKRPGVPGNCTLHARRVNGDGVGVFFLVLKCAVLLVRGPHASYAPSIYVDDHGEEDVGLRRGAPLRLHAGRVAALEALYNGHGVAREVARLRARSSRVIRDNYY